MNTQNKKQAPRRILYYDALETFAIFLVVSVHNVWLNDTVASSVSMALCPLAVPVFFMVHGALLLNKPFEIKKTVHRTIRTMLQLVAWILIYFMISKYFGWITESFSLEILCRYITNGATMNGGLGGSLWFMFALLQIYIFFPILHTLRNTNKKITIYTLILLFVFSFVNKETEIWGAFLGNKVLGFEFDLGWWYHTLSPFGKYANCIFFFTAGALLAEQITTLQQRFSRKHIIMASIFLIIAGITCTLLERKLEFGTIVYNWKPLSHQYMRFGTVLMAFGVFILFSQMHFNENRSNIIKTISVHTIDIYYIHPIIGRMVYELIFVQAYAGVLNNYIRAAIIMIISYAVGLIIRKIPMIRKLLQ